MALVGEDGTVLTGDEGEAKQQPVATGGEEVKSEGWAKILLDYCAGAVRSEEGFSTDRLYNLAEAYGDAAYRESLHEGLDRALGDGFRGTVNGPVGLNATPDPLPGWEDVQIEIAGQPVVGFVSKKERERELGEKLVGTLMELAAFGQEDDVKRVALSLRDTQEHIDGRPMQELRVTLVFQEGSTSHSVRGAVRL